MSKVSAELILTEKQITQQIRDLLGVLGAKHYKIYQTLGSERGIPDILACLQGRFVAIEVKARNRQPSEEQKRQLIELNMAGAVAFPAWSLDDVIRVIRQEFPDLGARILDYEVRRET